jgi:hypothetical protein
VAGRPRIYSNPDDLDNNSDQYFIECEEKKVRPTVTGLTLYLGFADKTTLYDYLKREEFSHSIKKALTRIENALEQKLENNSVAGIIFALKNMGWKDKQELEHSGEMVWKETKTYVTGDEK